MIIQEINLITHLLKYIIYKEYIAKFQTNVCPEHFTHEPIIFDINKINVIGLIILNNPPYIFII